MYDTATEPGGVLLTACGNRREAVCPPCSQVYKRDARQLVRAGLTGGKGVPETDRRAPVRVRHLHRPLVRAGPLPAHARQDRAALPTPPRRQAAPLPARPRHLLPAPPPRARPAARTAAVPRLLRLHRRRAVQRLRRRAVAPVHHLPAPPPGPPRRAHPQAAPRAGPRPLRQSRRIPGTRRHPLPRHHPPRRPRRHLPATPARLDTGLLCDAITAAAAAVAVDADSPDGPAADAAVR